jgi:transposase|tara:strand:+ start:32 stop:568 length:537 start_codon:yes stop_codon:yes gene_type:complete
MHVKRFAGAIGRRAKNDRLHAEIIAHYAEAIKPKLTELRPEKIRLMSDLVTRRNQLLTMQTMEKNCHQILSKTLVSTIKPILTALKNQITKIELKIQKLIEECTVYQSKNIILQSMPGIGKIAAASIISNMPELGYITSKPAASLIGVALMTKKVEPTKVSGSSKADDHKYELYSIWH